MAKLIQFKLTPFLQPWIVAGRRRITVLIHSFCLLCIWSLIICKWKLKTLLIYKMVDIMRQFLWLEIIAFTQELFAVLPTYPSVFDSTLGFPGEGWAQRRTRRRKRKRRQRKNAWSTKDENLTMIIINFHFKNGELAGLVTVGLETQRARPGSGPRVRVD